MRLNDGDMLVVGKLRLQAMHTPGHTRDSMCLRLEDRLLTGDTLLIGATGRTDLPTGDPEALYDSLFHCILKLDPTLKVFPAHDYGGRGESTLARELAENPRLRQRERAMFVETMLSLNLTMPTHITEALRTNMSGGKTVEQMLAEAAAAVPFMSLAELKARVEAGDTELIVLDVRERDAYESGHVPGARACSPEHCNGGNDSRARSASGLAVRALHRPLSAGSLGRRPARPGGGAARPACIGPGLRYRRGGAAGSSARRPRGNSHRLG